MAYEDYADYCIISHEGTEGCLEVGDYYDGEVYLTEDPNGRPTGSWVLVGAGKNPEGDNLYYIIDREYGYGLKVVQINNRVVHEPIDDMNDITAANDAFKWDIDKVAGKTGVFQIMSFAKQSSVTGKYLGITVLEDKQEQVSLVTGTVAASFEWDISLENEGTEVCPEVRNFSKSTNKAKNEKPMQSKASKSGSLGSNSNAAVTSTGIKVDPLADNTKKLKKRAKDPLPANRKKRPGYKYKSGAESSPSSVSPTFIDSGNAG